MFNHHKTVTGRRISGLLLVLALSLAGGMQAHAASVSATAIDKAGAPLADVVIYALPTSFKAPPAAPAASEVLNVAQQNFQFTPFVTPVRLGTRIRFPNFDHVEHHVKSFSAAKEFEFKLYDKDTPPPVTFDKPGIVIAYCLVHEWMRAYIYVLDTPYFGKTDASGRLTIADLPDGQYELHAWHPEMGTIKAEQVRALTLSGQSVTQLQYTFDFVPRKRKTVKPE